MTATLIAATDDSPASLQAARFLAGYAGERARLSREAQRLLLDDVPAMFPVGASSEYALLANGVEGYDFGAYDFNTGFLAANWTTGRSK